MARTQASIITTTTISTNRAKRFADLLMWLSILSRTASSYRHPFVLIHPPSRPNTPAIFFLQIAVHLSLPTQGQGLLLNNSSLCVLLQLAQGQVFVRAILLVFIWVTLCVTRTSAIQRLVTISLFVAALCGCFNASYNVPAA